MITEDFCSLEVAKLLKEKGFDELCIFKYSSEGVRMKAGVAIDEWQNSELDDDDECSCVSHQMAMKWLRETHNINIDIASIWNQKRFEYQVFVVTPENAKQCYIDDKLYLGYEEAVEAGIKYCLEKLI